jgi:pentapeptide MXKDX repeat protein
MAAATTCCSAVWRRCNTPAAAVGETVASRVRDAVDSPRRIASAAGIDEAPTGIGHDPIELTLPGDSMHKLVALIVAGAFAVATSAFAQTPPKTDAPKTDAAKTDAAKTDAAKTDTAKTDTAKTDTAKTNPQQEKMKACNAQAGDKKGDDRKAFMKTCLSAKPMAAAAPAKPESKMAMCNKKTAGMNKEDRAKAQSECMKAPT